MGKVQQFFVEGYVLVFIFYLLPFYILHFTFYILPFTFLLSPFIPPHNMALAYDMAFHGFL